MSAHTPAESYSRIASKYDGQSNEYSLWGELARGMYEGIVLKPQYRVIVDVGCGTGAALNHLQGRASPSVQLIGVEPSEQMRRLAEQRNAGIASVELREGSFEKLPLADGSVDYLYSIWAFHWTSDPRRAAEEIRRVLKDDGEMDLLFIGLNTGREFARKTAEVLSRYVDLETRLRAASMMASLDRGQVEELFSRFEAVGLTVEEETTTHYDTLDAHWAWQIRSESHYSVIPPGDRDRFDADLRAAIASLGDDRGIPYTRHSFHVRYRHVDRTFLAVPAWIDDLRSVVESESNRRPVSLCTLAAGSDDDLLTGAAQLRSYLADELRDESPPSDVCAVVNAGPGARSHRLALVADGVESLVQGLQLAAGGGAPALGARGVVKKRPVVAFVFSGQETMRTGAGRELFESCPAFRAGIERCARIADELIEGSLVDVLYRDTGGPIEEDIAAQIALFALQYSLAHLWRSWGVHPRVVAGHGLGEYAAACVAGVVPLEDAVRLIVGRGRVLRDLAPRGSMCNVRASFEQVRPYISDKERAVAITAFNAPKSLVLSGETHALELLRQELTAQLIETTPLQSVRALDSPLLPPAEEAFRSVCREAHLSPPQISFVSTVDGGREADVSNPEYWVRHMLRPVQFIEAVAALEKRGVSAYVEIGPGTTLIDMVAQFVGEGSAVRVPSLDGQQDDWSSMLACLGALYTQGVDIDWKRFSSPRPHRTVCLLAQEECSAPGARRGGGRDGDQLSSRAGAASSSSAWGWRLEETPAAARLATARRLIRAEVAELLGRDVGEQADQRGLMDLGLDSLRSVALARRLSDRIQQRVPETITFSRLNINALARFVLKALSLDTGEGAAPIAAPAPVERAAKEVIAIVGVSCRLPGGVVDPDGFWTLLEGARDTVSQGPADRSDVARWLGSNPEVSGKAPVRGASFLSDVTGFDPAVFSISPREALRMDPAHRLLLELCWEALENAAVDPRALVGTKTGLFIGLGPSEYDAVRPQVSTLPEIDPYSGLGTMSSVGVGRVSFVFGLQGPCVTVDTACSSSLVAVHMACQSLRSGECDVALAGGVSLLLSPGNFEWLAKCRALSADGRCKTFAAEADGYGRGEGGAVIVLKRLSQARADGDRVLALIRGSAINHDGASSGMTAPNGSAQEAVLKQALEDAGCAAPSVGYVEAHGTGTSLGDPIEVEALNAIYGNGRSADFAMWLGSVKTNIGHLEYAAGVAGLLKVVLSLQKGLIPAHLHAENLNPRIAWDDIPLAVTRTQMPWPEWNTPRRAGVSSFGISGTNVHMVLEEAPAPERAAELLVLSAESASALQTQAARLLERLKANAELGLSEVAFLATMYSPMEHRLAVTASSREALLAALETAAQGQTPNGAVRGEVRGSGVPKVVFVFPGQGSQWLGMGRQLLAQEPVFRAALEACDQAIQAEAGWSLFTELAADETSSQLGRIDVVQPVLFAMEVALAALWRSWGVEPDVVVGHSMGEVAAAHVAGALSLSDAVAIICRRSRLLRRISGQGEMAVVELSLVEAQAALLGYENRLSVAVSNSPRSTVLAGEPGALSEVLSKLEGAGVFCRRVKVDVASHSPQVDPLREELLSSLASLSPQPATVPMRSTVTGALLAGPELHASYWADNLRQPVRFSEAVQELLQGDAGLFVEMSPHPILATSVEENRRMAQRDGVAVGSLRRDQDERASLLEALGALWVQGYPLAWGRLFPSGGRRAHAVVEASVSERAAELLVLSAKSASALPMQAARLRKHLEARVELGLGDVAFSLATTRSAMEHRLAVAASSREALLAALEAAAEGQTPAGAVRGEVRGSGVPKVVFVFPGQGSQWLGMGRQLLAQEPAFRAALEACDQAIQAEAGWSLLAELAADETSSQLGRIDVVQPVLFAMEVALAVLWRSWGVEPDAVVGHSMGEVAAAHVAGALSLSDAVAIICRRSRLLKRISGQGEMAVVELSLAEAQAALVGYEDRLSVAVSNSPRSTVLAGEPAALSEVLSKLEGAGVFCRRVKVDVASHSPQVDPLREELLSSLASLSPQPATVPMRSTVTGALLAGPELQASYWVDNLRQPVRFSEAVQELLQGGHGLFVEMSPHPILATSVEENRQTAQRDGVAVGSLRRGQDERASLLESLGALWVQGYALAWERLFPAGGRRVPVPTYPWQRERYWIEAPAEGAAGSRRRAHTGGHPLLGEALSVSIHTGLRLWETTLDLERLPWLGDHRVQGAVVFPGAAYLEMALSAGAEALGDSPFQLTDVVITEALAFPGDVAVPVQVVTTEEQPGWLRFQTASRVPGAEGAFWRVHARGAVRQAERTEVPARLDLAALKARLGTCVPVPATYTVLGGMGLEYGPAFRGLAELWQGEGEALGRVRLPEAAGSPTPYRLHPALLDACFHATAGIFAFSDETVPWMPVKIGSLRLFQQPSGELWCHVRGGSQEQQPPDRRSADLWVVDSTGAVVAEITGLELQRLAIGARRREEDDWFLELGWEAAKLPEAKITSGRWLLLGDGGGLGAALRAALEAAGHAVVHAPAAISSAADVHTMLMRAFDGQPPTALVHLSSLEGSGTLDAQALEAALVRGCDSVLYTVQAVASMSYHRAPRLWLLTRGAQATGAGDVSVTQAPLLGLGRVIALENPRLRCARVDLDPAQPAGEVGALLAELLADDAEDEVALRGDERRVARLVRRLPETDRREKLEPAGDRPFRLEPDEPGAFDRLVLRATEGRAPGPGEVQIAVEAAGLSFSDVMKALGDGPVALSSECTGRIVAVGEGVQSLRVGQEVMTVASFSLGSHVTVDARRVVLRPAGLSAAQAAALPAVELASLAERRPERFAALLTEVMSLFLEGALAPSPVECLSISQAPEAFRKMAQARYTGKLVLTLQESSVQIRVPASSSAVIRADGSYLVTGGLGGLGLSVAGWLAARGAGHLVLVGRSGAASAEQQAAVAGLEARGARVTVAKADIADRAQVERVLGEVAATGMPLRGLVHAAGILDDGLLQQQTPERFRAVMAPKVMGALHLHALTSKAPLDFFVLYASAAGLLGSPGQGNYAAANTFLDALAHHRRARGLSGLSIDWGVFSEVGLAAAQENRGARLASRGMRNLTPGEGLWALERLLDSDRPQVGVVPLDMRQWVEFYPAAASSRVLSPLAAAPRSGAHGPAGDQGLLARLAAAEPGARARLLEEVLRAQASQVLRIPEDKLDADAPFTSLGMDSLMGLELRNRIESTLGINIPVTLLWTYPTVVSLSKHLAQGGLLLTGGAPQPPVEPEAGAVADEVANLDDNNLMAFIDGLLDRANDEGLT